MYDLIIIGGGPAAVAAGVYAARKKLSTLLITESFGGQSAESSCIYNWIGTPEISGAALATQLEAHVRAYTTPEHTLSIVLGRVLSVEQKDGYFTVQTSEQTYDTRTSIIATGSRRRKLPAEGADTFEHKGVMYCATCDGPLFGGQAVAVVGGGNAACEAVIQLAQYASHVTLIHRSASFRADPITLQSLRALPQVSIITEAHIEAVTGSQFVEGLTYRTSEGSQHLAVTGIFVEIGQLPNTDFIGSLVARDEYQKIIVDPMRQRTSVEGIWAAGDCTNGLYHQNNIAAGDAVKAIEDVYIWLSQHPLQK